MKYVSWFKVVVASFAFAVVSAAEATWPAIWSSNATERAFAITTDSSGNVYIAGESYSGPSNKSDTQIVKFDPDGNLAWARRYPVVADGFDNAQKIVVQGASVYVGGALNDSQSDGFFVLKYSTSGFFKWLREENGEGSDMMFDMTATKDGGVVVTGVEQPHGLISATTIKYSSTGLLFWKKVDETPPYASINRCLAVGAGGEIYVGGTAYTDMRTTYDFVVSKYTNTGKEVWVQRVNGIGDGSDAPYDIAVDYSGNVLVTGSSWASNGRTDYMTVKINAHGVVEWTERNGAFNQNDYATNIAIDHLNNVIVAGMIGSPDGTNIRTIKYDTMGNKLWQRDFLGDIYSHSSTDECVGMEVDASDNVFVGASTEVLGLQKQAYGMMKYAPDGTLQWTKIESPDVEAGTYPMATAIDRVNKRVYLTGHCYDPESGHSYAYTQRYYAEF